jgi:hypothetical protein
MLASRFQDYLYLPTPDPLYLVLGTVTANMLKGSSVWIVLIGAPSSGRTIMLETLADLKPKYTKGEKGPKPGVHIVGAIKGPSGLLSAVGMNERTKDATGGLLPYIGSRGIIVMKDFTSMLSMAKEPLAETIGALRETFDGRYSRPVGSDGGRHLEWRGRLGFLAASTPAIDRHSASIGDLGERWVYYRYLETDGYGETIKALGVRDPDQMMQELRGHVVNFVDALELEWNEERRELDSFEKNKLYAMASLICAARSGVPRDPYQGNEVTDLAVREAPPRMAGELGQLYLGLERIGLPNYECWRLVGKVALDSVRQLRMATILALHGSQLPMKTKELRHVLRCGAKTMEVLVDDLMIHGLLEISGKEVMSRDGESKAMPGAVKLTKWCVEQLELGWGTNRDGTNEYEEQ